MSIRNYSRPAPLTVRNTWYVSFDGPKALRPIGRRGNSKAAKTFRNELEAKAFARAKSAEGLIVRAGTINPFVPKRVIASSQVHQWFEELLDELPDEARQQS